MRTITAAFEEPMKGTIKAQGTSSVPLVGIKLEHSSAQNILNIVLTVRLNSKKPQK